MLLFSDNKFQQYDYGKDGNWKKYGQYVPPQYNLSNIATSIALHYADNDFLGTTEVYVFSNRNNLKYCIVMN